MPFKYTHVSAVMFKQCYRELFFHPVTFRDEAGETASRNTKKTLPSTGPTLAAAIFARFASSSIVPSIFGSLVVNYIKV